MHANDVQLVQVYAREKGGSILDQSFPSNTEFEVIIEAKAGQTIYGDGVQYLVQIAVRDLTNLSIVYKETLQGNMKSEPWVQPELSYPFLIAKQGSTKEDHVYDILASLSVGFKNPNVSFAKSPMFIIRKP